MKTKSTTLKTVPVYCGYFLFFYLFFLFEFSRVKFSWVLSGYPWSFEFFIDGEDGDDGEPGLAYLQSDRAVHVRKVKYKIQIEKIIFNFFKDEDETEDFEPGENEADEDDDDIDDEEEESSGKISSVTIFSFLAIFENIFHIKGGRGAKRKFEDDTSN